MKHPKFIITRLVLPVLPVFALLYSCGGGEGEASKAEPQGPGFFTSIYQDAPLKTSLTFHLDSLILHKDEGTEEEVDGLFRVGAPVNLEVPVELRSRGVTRKNLCAFPPIRLQVKRQALADNGWGGFRNYKLVTHCSDTSAQDDLLLREFLVYKMYERLTDICFRAQLLEMEYLANGDTLSHYAFLIENEEEMNDRLGLQDLDVEESGLSSIHLEHYKRFVLFQYMIGNTDWNLGTGHNTKYVLSGESNTPVVIPYDFDYCGLVNAPYARPFETIPIKNVRERYFMYRGKKADDFSGLIEEFKGHKEAWFSMIDDFPYLTESSKLDMVNYLTQFYDIIESPDWKDVAFAGR